MSPRLRRAIGLTAVPALALSTLAALPSAPASAAEPDPAPAAAGAAWLEDQLTAGVIHNDQFDFDDYGLTIDLGLALVEVGGHDATVDAVSTALAAGIENYVGDGVTESYAGPLAKAAVFARAAGDDPTAYGGVDLVDRLEARVLSDDQQATFGRIQDLSAFGDFANVIGQAYAARALDEAGSLELAEPATEFLQQQQCTEDTEGFFRQDFSAVDAPDQSCDGDAAAEPSTDVTALAVLELQGQTDDTDVQADIDDAVAWLLAEQNPNGSFGSGADIPTPNTNSTGLAGWALGVEEQTAAPERAAAWARGHQADDPAPCTTALEPDLGAIAYDGAAQRAGRIDGITTQTQDQWRRATSQALPVLQWAPLTGTGDVPAIDTDGYFGAGRKVTIAGDGFSPGATVCFVFTGVGIALAPAGHNGQARTVVTLPKGTAVRTFTSTDGEHDGASLSFNVLGAKSLRFGAKDRVHRGGKQVVKLRGLAPGERYKVKYRGKRVDAGTATDEGRATERFRVGRKLGKAKILVVGEFANRRGIRTFLVVR